MKHKNFEDFLMDYWGRHDGSTVLDDDCPDAFNDWLAGLDSDTWIELGDKYANTRHVDLDGLEGVLTDRLDNIYPNINETRVCCCLGLSCKDISCPTLHSFIAHELATDIMEYLR